MAAILKEEPPELATKASGAGDDPIFPRNLSWLNSSLAAAFSRGGLGPEPGHGPRAGQRRMVLPGRAPRATYSKFRRFQVTTDEQVKIPK
jgi:hypothetical protein